MVFVCSEPSWVFGRISCSKVGLGWWPCPTSTVMLLFSGFCYCASLDKDIFLSLKVGGIWCPARNGDLRAMGFIKPGEGCCSALKHNLLLTLLPKYHWGALAPLLLLSSNPVTLQLCFAARKFQWIGSKELCVREQLFLHEEEAQRDKIIPTAAVLEFKGKKVNKGFFRDFFFLSFLLLKEEIFAALGTLQSFRWWGSAEI